MKKGGRIILRVTSAGHETEDSHVFRGVAVNGEGDNVTARKYYVVDAKDVLLPVLPALGQIWKITAEQVKERVVTRGKADLTEVFITAAHTRIILPETENLFTRFIQSDNAFSGIGERLARRIWIRLGKNVYDILETKDTEKLLDITGITEKIAASLITGWDKYENLKQIAWFEKYNIPQGIARSVIKHHKVDSIRAIENDPYRLISFGIDFPTVDKIALQNFVILEDSYVRLRGAVEQALNIRSSMGHTVSSRYDLIPLVEKFLPQSLVTKALQVTNEKTAYIISDDKNYHTVGHWIMEQVISRRFSKLAAKKVWSKHYDWALTAALSNQKFMLTGSQLEAVKSALSERVSVIAGGAGTGKTFVLNIILRAYKLLKTDIRPMALSGRAARRITETTGFPAQTIAGFFKNIGEQPLGERALIVIDEASMIDLQTMFKLVSITTKDVRFLLVGDPNQLAPISAGLVLHEIVNVIPSVTLDIVKRQKESSGIPEFTRYIVDGRVPVPEMFNRNIILHSCRVNDIGRRVTALYKANPKGTQIISAMHSGLAGVDIINQTCQEVCNSTGRKLRFSFNGSPHYLNIRENDPVIFVKNNWDRGIQNGTLGTLLNVGMSSLTSSLDEVSLADIELYTGEHIPLTLDLLDNIRLAYGITLHKAQGSQFERIIVPVTNNNMMDNSWIYTALTRAETKIEIVGSLSDFSRAIARPSASFYRQTHLKTLLLAELEKSHQSSTTETS